MQIVNCTCICKIRKRHISLKLKNNKLLRWHLQLCQTIPDLSMTYYKIFVLVIAFVLHLFVISVTLQYLYGINKTFIIFVPWYSLLTNQSDCRIITFFKVWRVVRIIAQNVFSNRNIDQSSPFQSALDTWIIQLYV